MGYPQIYSQLRSEVLELVDDEVFRANTKHGTGPLADPFQVVSILTEELGEVAKAVNQDKLEDARAEMVQVAAVAINWLQKTGPHFTNK